MRTILEGPADHPDRGWRHGIVFAIRHRSWTRRARTTYTYHDVKHIIFTTTKRTRNLCLPHEVERLKEIGFNPRKEYVREMRDAINTAKRMRRSCFVTVKNLPSTKSE